MKCERCGEILNCSNIVIIKYKDDVSSKYSCSKCYLTSIRETIFHENLEDFIESITVLSSDEEMHEFVISKQKYLTGESWRAREIIDGIFSGYDFNISYNKNISSYDALKELHLVIKKGIEEKFVKEALANDERSYRINNGMLRGRIEVDELQPKRLPEFIVDGKSFSLEQLGEMLSDYEGCYFTIQISQ